MLSMEAMSIVTEDRKAAQESTFPNTYTFDLFGGVDVSSAVLFFLRTQMKDTLRELTIKKH